MTRVSRVTTAMVATVLASAFTVSAVTATPSEAKARRTPTPATFRISSFNVLGASHTVHSRKWDTGAVRIVRVNRLLERHHIDVAGFQEMQGSQLTKLKKITAGSWSFYPGLQLSRMDSENSIGWRTAKFDLLQATTLRIPYFNGHPRKMPLVLLREKATGMMLYVTNYHNPAETAKYHNQGHWRAEATRVEIALQNQLFNRGIPRFVTGDFNVRAPFFCQFAKQAPVIAARPNSYIKNGVCHANKPRAVDWILGARKVTFSGYDEDRSHLVDITTDHPVISSKVTVDPARLPRAWNTTPPPPVVPKVTY
jgi:hypothetical protein